MVYKRGQPPHTVEFPGEVRLMPAPKMTFAGLRALATFAEEDFLERSGETIRGDETFYGDDPPLIEEASESRGVQLTSTLGVGGMARVCLGLQSSLNREVAVKIPRVDRPGDACRSSVLREAQVLGQLEHPNVVPVHDLIYDDNGLPQIVLKRIEGEPWSELLINREKAEHYASGQDPLTWNVQILIGVCNAVDFAHSRGIIHRDVKPSNVMIGTFGEVTLLDWGIAIALPTPGGKIPIVGTPAYIAPEMLGDQVQTPQTDVYLLGAVLYEILAGEPPHRGLSLDVIVASILSPPPLPEDTPPALGSLCTRALNPDMALRPASAAAFRADLVTFLERRSVDLMVQSAEAQLVVLRSAAHSDDPDVDIIAPLSTCHFAFSHALQVLPDHATAREKLDESLHLAARWALSRDELALAAHHLSQASDRESSLQDELDAALERQASRDRRVKDLLQANDRRTGATTRIMLAVIMGVCTMTVGLTAHNYPPSYLMFAGFCLFMSSLSGVLIFSRRTPLGTVNGRAVSAAALGPIVQMVVDLCSWLRGWPARDSHGFFLLVTMCFGLAITMTVDRRVLPLLMSCLLLSVLTALLPEYTYLFQGCAGATIPGLAIAGEWLQRRVDQENSEIYERLRGSAALGDGGGEQGEDKQWH